MPRLVTVISVMCVVGLSAPALARCRGVQVGPYLYGVSRSRHVPCPAVIVSGQVVAPPVAVYAPPPQVVVTPPPMMVAPQVVVTPPPPPAPVVVAPAPVYTAPPIVYAPPVVMTPVAPKREPPPRPGLLAIKYMPGVSSDLGTSAGDPALGTPTFAHSAGLELRIARWFSLRSDLEFRKTSRTWDMLGAKVSLFPNSAFKPYASISFSGNEAYANPGKFSFGFAAAGGLDLFLGRYFFLEAEVRYRMTPGDCCSEVPALTGLVGGGIAFF